MIILLLAANLLFLAFIFVRERRRHIALFDLVTTEWRIAMAFIRDEHADMPHEFAAIFMAGNRLAMERKFPGYAEFRAERLRAIEEPEDAC